MRNLYRKVFGIMILTLLMVVFLNVPTAQADQQRSSPTISRFVIGSGVVGVSEGGVTFHTTLGQPVVGFADAHPVSISSGFWTIWEELLPELFLPMILR